MQFRRVVATGMGVVSALGPNAGEFWNALCAGRGGFRPIESVDRSLLCARIGAEVGQMDPAKLHGKGLRLADPNVHFAVLSAEEAITDAGIEWSDDLRSRTAVVTGSCAGSQVSLDLVFQKLYQDRSDRVHPFTISRIMTNAGATHIGLRYQISGPAYTVASACSSGSHAIGQAFQMIRCGMVDMAITGGSDSPFSLGHLKAWDAMRALAPDTCRPFSKYRRGMILGEGGAMLVLEPLETAQRRGARIYGEIVGFGSTNDPSSMTESSAEGSAAAIKAALRDGGLEPGQIGYINAHGTGTMANDRMETKAIRTVFGAHADRILVSATKSMHGHSLGAAGAMELVATVLALKEGLLPPTANYIEADPDCDLDVIPNASRRAAVEYAVSNSFALGGMNAVLAVRRMAS